MDDLRRPWRALLREPGFALISVLTLALGIGANTAIFSIVNGVLLRPLEYREPDRLVALWEVVPAVAKTYPLLPASARHFTEWRQRASSFESLTLMETTSLNLTGAGEPERVPVALVAPGFFDTLGAGPAIGRGFVEGENQDGHDRVAVISDALWRRRFHADAGILGKIITLDNQDHRIVGVLPAGFVFPSPRSGVVLPVPVHPEVYKPKVFSQDEMRELMGQFNYPTVARLRPGVSPRQASAELNLIAADLVKLSGEKTELRASVVPLRESMLGGASRGLLVLLGAVAAVLLIVCVNLANLALARAERHSIESAIRTALGASRGRLMRRALAESLSLALLGGLLGVAVAWGALGSLVALAPADLPRLNRVHLDGRVLLFALAIATLTGVLFGSAPAWRAASANPQSALKGGGRTASGGVGVRRLRSMLVVAQTGLAVILLVTAGLFTNSLVRLLEADTGFTAPSVLAVDLSIPRAKYSQPAQRNTFHSRLLERIQCQPGVSSAAISTALPLTGETWVDTAGLPGSPVALFARPPVNVRFVSPDYFRTMGIPLKQGRTFTEADRNRKVAVISSKLARTLWPDQDPVGRKFERNPKDEYEVIGVVGDVRADADKPPVAMVYRFYWEWAPRSVTLVVRAAGDPRSVSGGVRLAIRAVDAEVPIPKMSTMQEILEDSVAARRFQMLLASLFGATALLLAAVGIYGVVSYSVARRTNEIGIRIALGARSSTLLGMVLRQGMAPVALGLAGGLAASLAGGRLLAGLLYQVKPSDPVIMVGVTVLLALVGTAACYLPARRATRVDPLHALRCE